MNSEIIVSSLATGQSRIGTPPQASPLEYPIDDKTEARIKYFKDHGCTLEWAVTLMLLERVEILEDRLKRTDAIEAQLHRLEEKIKTLKDRTETSYYPDTFDDVL